MAKAVWTNSTPANPCVVSIAPDAGDLLIAYCITDTRENGSHIPDGWKRIGPFLTSTYDSGNLAVFYKIAIGDETSVSLKWYSNSLTIGGVVSYGNIDIIAPFVINPISFATSSGTTTTSFSATPTTNGAILVYINDIDDGDNNISYTFSTTSGTTGAWTTQTNQHNGWLTAALADCTQATAGALTAQCVTDQTGGQLAYFIGLRPTSSNTAAKNRWINSTPANPCVVSIAPDAGDLLVAYCLIADTHTDVNTPSGWTQIGSVLTSSYYHSALAVFYKVAAGSETSVSFSWPATSATMVGVVSYANIDTTTPIDVTPVSSQTSSATTTTSLSITPATSGAKLVYIQVADYSDVDDAFYAFSTTAGTTGPWITQTDHHYALEGRFYNAALADCTQATAGALTAQGVTDKTGGQLAFLIALRPASGGGGDITGTITASTGAATASASGTLTTAGTVAASTEAATASASGSLIAIGTVAANVGATEASASGNLITAGAVVAETGATTATASGTMTVTGTVEAATGAASVAATGSLTVIGTVSASTGATTCAAVGSVGDQPIVGTIAASTGAAMAAASGTLTVTGTVAASTGAPSCAATGALVTAGTIIGASGAVTATTVGSVVAGGTIAAATGAPTVSATGNLITAGSATASTGAVTTAASGSLTVVGAITASTGAVTASAIGSVGDIIVGTIAAFTGATMTNASGALVVTGTIATATGASTASASGALVVVGTIAASTGAVTCRAYAPGIALSGTIQVAGMWRSIISAQIAVNGVWRQIIEGQIQVEGVWRRII